MTPAIFLASSLLPVTLICLSTLILARTLLRHHPSGRYFLCLAALSFILLTPILVSLREVVGYRLVTLDLPEILPTVTPPTTTTAAPPYGSWIGQLTLLVWAVGIGIGSIRFAHGWNLASQLRKGARAATSIPEVVKVSVEHLTSRPLPPILTSSTVNSPVAVGLLSPVVILPEGLLETLSPVALRHVLLHESAHITLGHALSGIVERLVGVLLWPHPLIRPLCRELARAREEVCDNVASQEDGVACYARTLLALAQGMPPTPNLASLLALLGPETDLEARISGLLSPRRNKMIRLTQGRLWAALGLTACALTSLVAIRVATANPKTDDGTTSIKLGNVMYKTVLDGKVGPAVKNQSGFRTVIDEEHAAKLKAEAEAIAGGSPSPGSHVMPKAGASAAEEMKAKHHAELSERVKNQ